MEFGVSMGVRCGDTALVDQVNAALAREKTSDRCHLDGVPRAVGLTGATSMPMGYGDKLDQLYARQRLLTDEAARLETECRLYGPDEPGNRHYILEIQIAALYEE
jgi:hypothetical protein